MEIKTRVKLTLFVLVVISLGFYFLTGYVSKTTGYAVGESEEVKLAQCLDGKNAILYVALDCPDCEKQKEIFGEGVRFLNINVCGEKSCFSLQKVPAWNINGNYNYGFKTLEEIKTLSGC